MDFVLTRISNGRRRKTSLKRRRKMKIQPLADYVVIQCDEAVAKTPGGIVLPTVAKEKSSRGIVISVGPGKVLNNGVRREMHVKPGDKILFTCGAGTVIKDNDKEYLIMDELNIIAVIKEALEYAQEEDMISAFSADLVESLIRFVETLEKSEDPRMKNTGKQIREVMGE